MDDVNGRRSCHRGRSGERHYWRDLWRYRELFQVLAWRDLSVRYKQTVIGVLRALIYSPSFLAVLPTYRRTAMRLLRLWFVPAFYLGLSSLPG
jgi:ABC-type polysaccharide/polyol phosphate export permease